MWLDPRFRQSYNPRVDTSILYFVCQMEIFRNLCFSQRLLFFCEKHFIFFCFVTDSCKFYIDKLSQRICSFLTTTPLFQWSPIAIFISISTFFPDISLFQIIICGKKLLTIIQTIQLFTARKF